MDRRFYYAPHGHVHELDTLKVKNQFWVDERKEIERKYLCVIKRKDTEE
jgi:hypothetical protein